MLDYKPVFKQGNKLNKIFILVGNAPVLSKQKPPSGAEVL
jgi:hypothetical protein